jgi:hypothetical protein
MHIHHPYYQVVLKIFRGIHDVQFDTRAVNVVTEGYHELKTNRKLMALDCMGLLPATLKRGMVRVVDVTESRQPATIVRRDGLCGSVHYTCSECVGGRVGCGGGGCGWL